MNTIFNEEQQAHIDSLIKKKFAEAHAKAEAKAAEQIAAVEAKHAEETNTLKAELEKLQAVRGENDERVRKALLQAEVAGTNAIKPDQLMKLLDGDFKLGDDGALMIIDAKGTARLDASGKPLFVKSYLEAFLKDNPHLQKSSGTPGSGSMTDMFISPFNGAATMRRGDFDNLSAQLKSNFIQSGGSLTD